MSAVENLIRFKCRCCNKQYKTHPRNDGGSIRCKRCYSKVLIEREAPLLEPETPRAQVSKGKSLEEWLAVVVSTALLSLVVSLFFTVAMLVLPARKQVQRLQRELDDARVALAAKAESAESSQAAAEDLANDLEKLKTNNKLLDNDLSRVKSDNRALVASVSVLKADLVELAAKNGQGEKPESPLLNVFTNPGGRVGVRSSSDNGSDKLGDLKYDGSEGSLVWVDSYTRDDGTFVRGHYRKKPGSAKPRSTPSSSLGRTWVTGYTSKDGTRVRGH